MGNPQLNRRRVGKGWPKYFYRFFPFVAAFSKVSLTLNSTIFLIKSKGIGWSNGNLADPLRFDKEKAHL
jgi:hypothetical protein